MQVRSLIWEDPLEKEMATHSSIFAWEIPWTEEPMRWQSIGSQKSQTRLNNNNKFKLIKVWSFSEMLVQTLGVSSLKRCYGKQSTCSHVYYAEKEVHNLWLLLFSNFKELKHSKSTRVIRFCVASLIQGHFKTIFLCRSVTISKPYQCGSGRCRGRRLLQRTGKRLCSPETRKGILLAQ